MKTKLHLLALAALLFLGLPLASSSAHVGISVGIAPPLIPVYSQPYCPAPGYLWTPGYWAWDGYGYYWVPGVWVAPPRIGFLWTPGYWGYSNGLYAFNQGYWGRRVGYYGGINYGFGYGGRGYYGGRWNGSNFLYNTAVTRVNTSVITTTYVNREMVNPTSTRASFNGPGGVNLKPSRQEQAVAKSQRISPTSAQLARVEAAKKDPALKVKNNKGKPKASAIQALDTKIGEPPAAAAAAGKPDRGAKQNRAAAQDANAQPDRAAKQNRSQDRAAVAREATAPDQTSANKRAGEKRANVAKPAKQGPKVTDRPATKSSRKAQVSTPKAAPKREVRKPVSRPQITQRPKAAQRPQVQRRPQAEKRQMAPAPRGGGRGQATPAPEEGKKKKKKRPDGQ